MFLVNTSAQNVKSLRLVRFFVLFLKCVSYSHQNLHLFDQKYLKKTGILLNIIYDLRILEGFMHVNVS